ncbi:MAG: putative aminohydrolase SsnA, partial [Lachnospiraceae bacterium]|nr:putative aminohydrolase SsnA [Lachnospiraceae bacterium]
MLLVGNGKVITRDAKQPFIEGGAVVIDGDKIKAVGKEKSLRESYPDAAYVNAHGGVIMPGFINTHEHIYSALARGLSIKGYAPKGFLEILDGMWWNIDRHLTLEGTYASAIATYIECIKCGVTTIFDHHASYGSIRTSLSTIEKAAKKAGIRSCLCYEVSDRDGGGKMREAALENEEFLQHAKEDKSHMIAGMFGLHASFTLSDDTLDYCREHTPEGSGYHIHVAEGIEDLHDCLKKHGKRIVDRLMDHGILGDRTLLAHCIYVNDHEMELIRETDTMVVHNPESNMGNACGCPPTMEMVHKGILTGLGTDGYTHDMTESYKVANL